MRPSETLKSEHRVIEEMLDILQHAAGRLTAGQQVDPRVFAQAIDFFRNFADRCHHGKEERHLFVRLVAKGVPREGGPVGVMLAEHETGRAHIRAMGEALDRWTAGDQAAAAELAQAAQAYAQLLSAHIQKEDHVLFPLADRILTAEEQDALAEVFAQVEAEEMGEGVHERYHHLVHALREAILDRER